MCISDDECFEQLNYIQRIHDEVTIWIQKMTEISQI